MASPAPYKRSFIHSPEKDEFVSKYAGSLLEVLLLGIHFNEGDLTNCRGVGGGEEGKVCTV